MYFVNVCQLVNAHFVTSAITLVAARRVILWSVNQPINQPINRRIKVWSEVYTINTMNVNVLRKVYAYPYQSMNQRLLHVVRYQVHWKCQSQIYNKICMTKKCVPSKQKCFVLFFNVHVSADPQLQWLSPSHTKNFETGTDKWPQA